MSGARDVAANAIDYIESLITEMLAGGHTDNEISLGRLLSSNQEIQVQLKSQLSEKIF
ncbi:hypothetical protein [Shewanella surugensis]|uniref:Uncharacterized protein n=1 Tax=Shewanella surugensis TaxID=212020 RepID=A0ABT0L7I0_9GAMM|nr:hypothetical protein [Shewanella surugensis]MCL1123327.1 hypothetical protein [Shewanella surugensis]